MAAPYPQSRIASWTPRHSSILVASGNSEVDQTLISMLRSAEISVVLSTHETAAATLLDSQAEIVVASGPVNHHHLQRLAWALRAVDSTVPLLLISDGESESGVVLALRNGADEVITDLSRCLELEARIRALLRRCGANREVQLESPLSSGDFLLDPSTRTLRHGDSTCRLSPRKYQIMRALIGAQGRVLTNEQLCVYASIPLRRGSGVRLPIATHICDLRKAIEQTPGHPRHLLTVSSVGYRFVATPIDDRGPVDTKQTANDSKRALFLT